MTFEEFKQFCRTLPGTTEDIKWEDHLTFCVGEKMYAITSLSEQPAPLSIKADEDTFDRMTAMPGIIPAPYLARYKWIRLERLDVIDDALLRDLIRESYQLVFNKLPKRLRTQIEAGA